MTKDQRRVCLFTFDVEEWFQVENLKAAIDKDSWIDKQTSVVKNINKLLSILSEQKVTATFFVLGWIAEKYPDLVKTILKQGHEIASHGYGHDLTFKLNDTELKYDIKKSKSILENITGNKIWGYRAPNFSVDKRLIDCLIELGFKYDSSYNPFKLNQRYGSLSMAYTSVNNMLELNNNFFEIPVSTYRLFSFDLPISGGAYFRLFPAGIFRKLIKSKLRKDGFYHFYLHPWELEPEQPRINNIKLNYRIRHYTGLKKTADRLTTLIKELKQYECQFMTMKNYLNSVDKLVSLQ